MFKELTLKFRQTDPRTSLGLLGTIRLDDNHVASGIRISLSRRAARVSLSDVAYPGGGPASPGGGATGSSFLAAKVATLGAGAGAGDGSAGAVGAATVCCAAAKSDASFHPPPASL